MSNLRNFIALLISSCLGTMRRFRVLLEGQTTTKGLKRSSVRQNRKFGSWATQIKRYILVTMKTEVHRLPQKTVLPLQYNVFYLELDDKDEERFILVTLREAKFEGSRRQS